MGIKELRLKAQLTQVKAAEYVGIPLRTFIRYESNQPNNSVIKKDYIEKKLSQLTEISETKGILSLDELKTTIIEICKKHDIQYCYLFGSYAKNTQTEKSDIDLMIKSEITGLEFFGLVEEFRIALKKKVDLLRFDDIIQNDELLNEIFKDGIKIYG